MKKITFNDKYCLTQSVLDGTKTMTRRLLKVPKTCNGKEVYSFNVLTNNAGTQCVDLVDENEGVLDSWKPRYEIGEVVAIAQSYYTIGKPQYDKFGNGVPGNSNKMFTRAELLPRHIQFTDVKAERLRDISDEDILKEGIFKLTDKYFLPNGVDKAFTSAREAFAYLIDKIGGKGTWESNPWVVAYSFELVD